MGTNTNSKSGKSSAVSEFLKPADQQLSSLLGRARYLDKIDQTLAAALEPNISPHVRVANVRNRILILITPVAPIASRLRLQQAALLSTLQSKFPDVFDSLDIRVTPDMPPRA